MKDRVLILGVESASLFEPGLRGENALQLDYYDGYVKLLRLASDDMTGVYASESATPAGCLQKVDLESLSVLDADQAQLRIRKSYLVALHQRHRKALARFTSRRRGGHGDGPVELGWSDAFGGDAGGGDGGGGD